MWGAPHLPLPALLLLVTTGLGSCAGGQEADLRSRVVRYPPEPGIDRIVLVSIDTLRADHLGSYGYPRRTSPFLDLLAKEGVRFENAMSCIATTAPSHASLFTSLYPLEHRLMMNGQRLDPSCRTMAEILGKQGFLTAGFVSTRHHFSPGGLDAGFDVLDEPTGKKISRPATSTVDAAIAWLEHRDPGTRLFLWLHLFDPHRPLSPPSELLREVREGPGPQGEALAEFVFRTHHADRAFWAAQEERVVDVVDAYDAEILYADREVERLYRRFQELGLGPRSLWIVTADHGEGLGNHAWMEHGRNVYNEELRVPLIWHYSSRPNRGAAVDTLVETIDVLPTLCEVLGLRVPLRGASLASFLDGEGEPYASTAAFSQRRMYDPAHRAQGRLQKNYEPGSKYALQDGRFKYVLRTEGEDELFHLTDDPYELDDLVGRGLAVEARMHDELVELVRSLEEANPGQPTYADDEVFEGLRALGYVR